MKTVKTPTKNEVQPIASAKSKVKMTTDTAKYNADGSLESLSATYPVDSGRNGTDISEDPPTVSAISATRADAWDEVNTLRRALKENSRGYLASTAAVVISCCFLVSIAVGSLLAMPVVMVVATYDSLQRFFNSRKAAKESTTGATIAAELGLRVVSSSEVE
jgi:hypothetical protein